jgi:hypothetical protein
MGTLRPRDENGWRIPEPNSMSYRIYEMLLQGVRPMEMATQLETTQRVVGVLIWRIKHPERHQKAGARHYENKKRKREAARDAKRAA